MGSRKSSCLRSRLFQRLAFLLLPSSLGCSYKVFTTEINMAEACGLQKPVYTTGKKSHSSLGFLDKRFSQTFILGLPVMGEHPSFSSVLGNISEMHSLCTCRASFLLGKASSPSSPGVSWGLVTSWCAASGKCKAPAALGGQRLPSPPLPHGEKNPAFPHYTISMEVSFCYTCGTSLFRPFLPLKRPFSYKALVS